MKRHLLILGKAVGFFVLWGLLIVLITIPAVVEPAFLGGNVAFLGLWAEFLPLLATLIATAVFVKIDKVRVPLSGALVKDTLLGLGLGVVWLGAVVAVLYFGGVLAFGAANEVSYLGAWFVAALFNVAMQNVLVRGYLFELFKVKYHVVWAVIVTTVLFTALHSGIFAEGLVPVLNVATMSLFVSLLLLYTGGLWAPIVAHFVWNSVGRLIFGVVSLGYGYPNWLSGNYQIEGSLVTLVLNVLLIAWLGSLLWRKKLREGLQ